MSKKNLTLKAVILVPAIDWALVDSLPMSDMPDGDSPELTAATLKQLRPVAESLPDVLRDKC